MKRTLIASVGLIAALTDCATVTTEVAPRVAQAVKVYCSEPLAERQLIRSQVNGLVAPATVRVTCPGDTD